MPISDPVLRPLKSMLTSRTWAWIPQNSLSHPESSYTRLVAQSHRHPMPKAPAFSPPSQPNLRARPGTASAVVLVSGWEAGLGLGSHLQDHAVRLVEVRGAPTGAGVFLCCWP